MNCEKYDKSVDFRFHVPSETPQNGLQRDSRKMGS